MTVSRMKHPSDLDLFGVIGLVRGQRERDAARNPALPATGIPLYLYHWRSIRREATSA